MPMFDVDVKAFISITVEADDENEARDAANHYVETSLSPSDMEIAGWNEAQAEEGVTTKITDAAGWGVDGESEVEPLDE